MWDLMHDFYIARPQENCQLKIFIFEKRYENHSPSLTKKPQVYLHRQCFF